MSKKEILKHFCHATKCFLKIGDEKQEGRREKNSTCFALKLSNF